MDVCLENYFFQDILFLFFTLPKITGLWFFGYLLRWKHFWSKDSCIPRWFTMYSQINKHLSSISCFSDRCKRSKHDPQMSFFLFLMWCVYMNTCGVCVCLCICICVWMQAHTTVPVDVRGQVQMLVLVFHIVWISYAVHCWVHPDDRQWASRDVPIWAFHLSVRVPRLQISATMFKFYMDSGDRNSVPHIYRLYLWHEKKFRD